jgi:hypothetical protein
MAVEDIASRPAEIDLPERYLDRRRLASSGLPHFAERPCSWAHKQVDPRPPGGPPKQIQAKPNQTKSNQAKLLGFIWFYSSETGLFNGLQRIQIKKSFSLQHRVLNVTFVSLPALPLSLPLRRPPEWEPSLRRVGNDIAWILDLGKIFRGKI